MRWTEHLSGKLSAERLGVYPVAFSAAILWSATIGAFLGWDIQVAQQHAEELARHEARVRFSKEVAIRNWVSSHGGVYVPATDATPPNPYLKDIPERDITTPSGKHLTLVNPAYALRLLSTQFADPYGAKSRLTSLKPLNPANAPDSWEASILRRFEQQGETEVAEFVEMDGKPYLRQMALLPVVKGCLKCHAQQGYKEGDVRGGIVVSVPMQPYLDSMEESIRKILWPVGAIWMAGLALIAMLAMQVRRRMIEQKNSETLLLKKNEETLRAHADLARFADVSAHHLMEPVRRLSSYSQLVRRSLEKYPDVMADRDAQDSLLFLEQASTRLRALVRDIQLYLAASQPRGELRLEDANLVLAGVEQKLSARIRESGATITSGDLPLVKIDRQRLSDLFMIVIENALRHGGPIDETVPPRIDIRGEVEGGVCRYYVSDNGPGIPAEYRERVFDIFETLNGGAGESTGVGLSIARRIVESCHGRIWIENSGQGGAMVVFELPAGGYP